jgi:hypothetical protein
LRTTTLAQQLQSSTISFKELHSSYHPMLELVRELLSVVPNCDPFLEIWPVGFRSYNLITKEAHRVTITVKSFEKGQFLPTSTWTFEEQAWRRWVRFLPNSSH